MIKSWIIFIDGSICNNITFLTQCEFKCKIIKFVQNIIKCN